MQFSRRRRNSRLPGPLIGCLFQFYTVTFSVSFPSFSLYFVFSIFLFCLSISTLFHSLCFTLILIYLFPLILIFGLAQYARHCRLFSVLFISIQSTFIFMDTSKTLNMFQNIGEDFKPTTYASGRHGSTLGHGAIAPQTALPQM